MNEQYESLDGLSPERPAELLSRLMELVAQRVPAEEQIPSVYSSRQAAIQKQSEQAQGHLEETCREQRETIESQYTVAVRRTEDTYAADRAAAQRQYAESRGDITGRFDEAEAFAKRHHEEAHWEAATVFEATKDGPKRQLAEIEAQVTAWQQEMNSLSEHAAALLDRRWQLREYPDPGVEEPPAGNNLMLRLAELVGEARERHRQLLGQSVPALFEGWQPFWLVVLLWLAGAVSWIAGLGWNNWYWLPASFVTAVIAAAALFPWLYRIARRQSEDAFLPLRRAVALGDRVRQKVLQKAKADCDAQYAAIVQRRDDAIRSADAAYAARSEEFTLRRQSDLERVEKTLAARLAEITQRRERELAEAGERYTRIVRELDESFRREMERLKTAGQRALLESDQRFQRRWREMAGQWREGVEKFCDSLLEIDHACARFFPDWKTTDWSEWMPRSDVLPPIRLGHYQVELARIPGGIPEDDRLRPEHTQFALPALLPFPDRSLLLLKSEGEGRAAAIEILQSAMLRMLTALPPGKVRFTIIDPVGLGENFAAFMHLADFDEQLVANRIWTDMAHIPHRLADLTEHMENVLQVYLRNEFESIHQYNAAAGEMAEPYRVLVIANFPSNFTEEACRRLVSVVSSGARCGVFTLMSVDRGLPPPPNFSLADLEANAIALSWQGGRFVSSHPKYGELPLAPEPLPGPERFTEIVKTIGRKVPDAGRVEVPFTHVAPVDGEHWSGDTRNGIDVPLGRAGAMKLQNLRLGRGTSQHVLIAGKTGSGKSTLLHVLITNLALRYPPDEVEFYLVDFKKGVEFKAYASHGLPHARVVAIESEREFGLSVLERLDAELRHRGDLFRRLGVQDLAGFRAAQPEAKLPRALLIIDEFQELFVEDDRIGQNAALLLDRLVRQGRAFGIHVLLGSQTLGGAYSLARTTIGQMAVRIALQCSEADAHLILSEDNTGARLLSRPGEAIYNDANGLFEGNHPFQTAWLSDHERDRYLDEVAQLAAGRNCVAPPPIVFEGNVSADVRENAALAELLRAPAWA
ncbi:MAG: cell division protein FtsK, partial [Pirellulales bacterium]|nr:cell division protein FtsK [Pirellulales bacterium]